MPWFKVDDNLAFHAKTVAAGNAAMGLWVRAGSWSAQQLTDGHVPEHMVIALGATKTHAARLVAAGLWLSTDEGYRFHQWEERQPTREKVEADRAEAAERMRKAREKKRSSEHDANTDRSSPAVAVTPTRPDPTRPVLVSPWDEEVEVDVSAADVTSELPPTEEEIEAVRSVLRSLPWVPDSFPDEEGVA